VCVVPWSVKIVPEPIFLLPIYIYLFVAAFVMAMFFTPSLTALIGHAAWWPGHGDETTEQVPESESA